MPTRTSLPLAAVPVGSVGAVDCCAPLARAALDPDQATDAATLFKALGDPVRLRIFSMIASAPGGELCVCDIDDVGVAQPTVSHHLRKLREAGLVTTRKEATWVHYRVAPQALAAMAALLQPAP